MTLVLVPNLAAGDNGQISLRPEIASVLGIPENTVYSRLRRAKDHLRKALEHLSEAVSEREHALFCYSSPTAKSLG